MVQRIIILVTTLVFLATTGINGQRSYQTFKDTRVINSQSVETLKKGILDFRIGHRFGNVNGGWTTLWGLENAADVIFEFDYGLTDNMMIGLMRAKGSGPLKQNVSGLWKFRVLEQSEKSPFSMAFSGLVSISTMPRNPNNPGVINFFEVFAHRMTYNFQAIIASKISERLAIQIAPQITYRNIIAAREEPNRARDTNILPSVSGALKFQLNKSLAIIVDGTLTFSEFRSELNSNGDREFFPPLGFGLEWETGGGHVFQINLTNASGIVETDYIPYTMSSWTESEFRFGFTIARKFKL